jgi:hypothetical protein
MPEGQSFMGSALLFPAPKKCGRSVVSLQIKLKATTTPDPGGAAPEERQDLGRREGRYPHALAKHSVNNHFLVRFTQVGMHGQAEYLLSGAFADGEIS